MLTSWVAMKDIMCLPLSCDITTKIIENGEDQHYQHFFLADNIRPSYGGKKENGDTNSPDFFSYFYCDTTPWDKTNKFDGAKFTGEKNPVGLKGYFIFNSQAVYA